MLLAFAVLVSLTDCSSEATRGGDEVGRLTWSTDLPKAMEQAKAEKKAVLLDFTGSDWCPPCKELHKKVLVSRGFEDYAETNLVLVVVDFPQRKPQTEELQKANQALAEKFDVGSFPTLILLDADGKVLRKSLDDSTRNTAELISELEKARKGA